MQVVGLAGSSCRSLGWNPGVGRCSAKNRPEIVQNAGRSKSEQHAQALADVCHDLCRGLRFENRPTDLPIQVLHVVGENNPANPAPGRQKHLEWIALDVTRDWTRDRQPSLRVVRTRRQDQGWAPAALLMSRLRIERQPDEIPCIGYILAGYHVS